MKKRSIQINTLRKSVRSSLVSPPSNDCNKQNKSTHEIKIPVLTAEEVKNKNTSNANGSVQRESEHVKTDKNISSQTNKTTTRSEESKHISKGKHESLTSEQNDSSAMGTSNSMYSNLQSSCDEVANRMLGNAFPRWQRSSEGARQVLKKQNIIYVNDSRPTTSTGNNKNNVISESLPMSESQKIEEHITAKSFNTENKHHDNNANSYHHYSKGNVERANQCGKVNVIESETTSSIHNKSNSEYSISGTGICDRSTSVNKSSTTPTAYVSTTQRENWESTPLSRNDFDDRDCSNSHTSHNQNMMTTTTITNKKKNNNLQKYSRESQKVKGNDGNELVRPDSSISTSHLRRKDSFPSTSISFSNINLSKCNMSSKNTSNTTYSTTTITTGNSTINSLSEEVQHQRLRDAKAVLRRHAHLSSRANNDRSLLNISTHSTSMFSLHHGNEPRSTWEESNSFVSYGAHEPQRQGHHKNKEEEYPSSKELERRNRNKNANVKNTNAHNHHHRHSHHHHHHHHLQDASPTVPNTFQASTTSLKPSQRPSSLLLTPASSLSYSSSSSEVTPSTSSYSYSSSSSSAEASFSSPRSQFSPEQSQTSLSIAKKSHSHYSEQPSSLSRSYQCSDISDNNVNHKIINNNNDNKNNNNINNNNNSNNKDEKEGVSNSRHHRQKRRKHYPHHHHHHHHRHRNNERQCKSSPSYEKSKITVTTNNTNNNNNNIKENNNNIKESNNNANNIDSTNESEKFSRTNTEREYSASQSRSEHRLHHNRSHSQSHHHHKHKHHHHHRHSHRYNHEKNSNNNKQRYSHNYEHHTPSIEREQSYRRRLLSKECNSRDVVNDTNMNSSKRREEQEESNASSNSTRNTKVGSPKATNRHLLRRGEYDSTNLSLSPRHQEEYKRWLQEEEGLEQKEREEEEEQELEEGKHHACESKINNHHRRKHHHNHHEYYHETRESTVKDERFLSKESHHVPRKVEPVARMKVYSRESSPEREADVINVNETSFEQQQQPLIEMLLMSPVSPDSHLMQPVQGRDSCTSSSIAHAAPRANLTPMQGSNVKSKETSYNSSDKNGLVKRYHRRNNNTSSSNTNELSQESHQGLEWSYKEGKKNAKSEHLEEHREEEEKEEEEEEEEEQEEEEYHIPRQCSSRLPRERLCNRLESSDTRYNISYSLLKSGNSDEASMRRKEMESNNSNTAYSYNTNTITNTSNAMTENAEISYEEIGKNARREASLKKISKNNSDSTNTAFQAFSESRTPSTRSVHSMREREPREGENEKIVKSEVNNEQTCETDNNNNNNNNSNNTENAQDLVILKNGRPQLIRLSRPVEPKIIINIDAPNEKKKSKPKSLPQIIECDNDTHDNKESNAKPTNTETRNDLYNNEVSENARRSKIDCTKSLEISLSYVESDDRYTRNVNKIMAKLAKNTKSFYSGSRPGSNTVAASTNTFHFNNMYNQFNSNNNSNSNSNSNTNNIHDDTKECLEKWKQEEHTDEHPQRATSPFLPGSQKSDNRSELVKFTLGNEQEHFTSHVERANESVG